MVTSVLLICLANTAFADHGNNLITWSNVTVLVFLCFLFFFVCLLICLFQEMIAELYGNTNLPVHSILHQP